MGPLQDRDEKIRKNLADESRVLDAIERQTGIRLPRLQWIGTATGPDAELLKQAAASLIPGETNEVIRQVLYAVFRPTQPVAADDATLKQLIAWHREEKTSEPIQVLERALLSYANRATRAAVVDCLLAAPHKIQTPGFRFLAKTARSNDAVRQRILEAFESCLFDLEHLAVIANRHPADWDIIAGCGPDSDRLSGARCHSLVRYQLPDNEYGFRRPALVPYYARIVASMRLPASRLPESAAAWCRQHGFQDPDAAAFAAISRFTCLPLLVDCDTVAGHIRAVIVTAIDPESDRGTPSRHRHRPASLYRLDLILAPMPPPWNLFPKKLLRPDDPIRFVRPDPAR